MRMLQIVSGNGTYGYKGRLFHKCRSGSTEVITHAIENDAFAQELLDVENSPFREVNENGDPIDSAKDKAKTATETRNRARRTVDTPSAIALQKAQEGKGDITLDELKSPKPASKAKAAKATTVKKPAVNFRKPAKPKEEPAVVDAAQPHDPTTEGEVGL